MKKIKFPTHFPHSDKISPLQVFIFSMLKGIKKRQKPLFISLLTLYPGSDLNRYVRNEHRILSPVFTFPKPLQILKTVTLVFCVFRQNKTFPHSVSALHPTPLNHKKSYFISQCKRPYLLPTCHGICIGIYSKIAFHTNTKFQLLTFKLLSK